MDGRVKHLKIPGALLIEAVGSADERRGFLEYLRAADLQAAGCGLEVAQVNCSVLVRGALRGIAVAAVPRGTRRLRCQTDHSARVGARRAARMAGSSPARAPMMTAAPRPPAQASVGMTMASWWACA
jgi:dTDP-4-dehydrorhamnose 3,5-epimerase